VACRIRLYSTARFAEKSERPAADVVPHPQGVNSRCIELRQQPLSTNHTVFADGLNPYDCSALGQPSAKSTSTATRRHRGRSPASRSSLAAITCGWSTS
jgi:hypothetical protein